MNYEALKTFAKKYIWWKTPDEAVAFPERLVAQVMKHPFASVAAGRA